MDRRIFNMQGIEIGVWTLNNEAATKIASAPAPLSELDVSSLPRTPFGSGGDKKPMKFRIEQRPKTGLADPHGADAIPEVLIVADKATDDLIVGEPGFRSTVD